LLILAERPIGGAGAPERPPTGRAARPGDRVAGDRRSFPVDYDP
jgi:hypothetical protein